MNVWLIQADEMLPFQKGVRKMRTMMLAEKMLERRHNVLWWTSAFDHIKKEWRFGRDTEVDVGEGLRIKALKGLGYKKNISLARFVDLRIIAWKFKKYAPKMPKPDIIIAATPSYDLAYQAVKFARRNKIPVIVDIRDEWPELFLNFIPSKFRKIGRLLLYSEFKMFREAVQGATALISMMNSMLDWGLRYADRPRSPNDKVFYLGSYRNSPPSEIPDKLSFLKKLKGKFIVTFAGTFVQSNAPGILIEVARRLTDKNIYFVLGGDGELWEELKQRATELPKVFMPGWLNEVEISALLAHSSVGISPSPLFREAFPNKIFSYLSAELPVISAFQGDLREIIEKYQIGFYYPPNDVDALTKRILELYENPELLRKFSQNAGRVFSEMFDADKIYTEYAEYLERIAEKYRRNNQTLD